MKGTLSSKMTINNLVDGLKRSLCLLTPIAEELGMHWRNPDNYLDWDSIAIGAFEGFVLSALRASAGWHGFLDLLQYDRRVNDYTSFSYIAVVFDNCQYPLVCLQTIVHPFDTCLVVELNDGVRGAPNWTQGGVGSGWNDATNNTYPDWVEVDFAGTKTIAEVDVFTYDQNNPNPTISQSTVASDGQISDFAVQSWDGSNWVTVPSGNVTGTTRSGANSRSHRSPPPRFG